MKTLSSLCLLSLAAATATAAAPSFENDVMAVLSKAGCNAGACHGNQNGKAGFKLSLRGQDPQQDYQWLVREHAGRRVNRLSAERSLILLKPTSQLPHQGGKRFRADSEEYRILHEWILAGAPGPDSKTPRLERLEITPPQEIVVEPAESVQLQVIAQFSDGSRRDVTHLSVYETSDNVVSVRRDGLVQRQSLGETTVLVRFLHLHAPVRMAFVPARPDFVWSSPPENNFVDKHINSKLKSLRIEPSELSDDSTFVRRAYLDALGILPTVEEARTFVADQQPNKRAKLIDDLLARPEFADHWALKWSDLLRNEEKVLDSKGVETFHKWIRDSIVAGKPVNHFVRELIAAKGSTYKNPPANFWRASRDPLTRAETTARLFLGTRLQCAKCHNHPFERWTQDDYYRWAALFARIDYKIVENKRPDKFDKNQFVGEQIVLFKDEGEVENARTGQVALPRFLGAETPPMDAKADRLTKLADWLTHDRNELFAKSQVNWIWYHVMGRGLVEPIDDFRETNPPINAKLLNALARDFVASDFDLRRVVRIIMTSHTYQLSALPNETNQDDQANFSRAVVRRLTAEQLLDAQSSVLGTPVKFAGYDQQLRAGQLPGVRRVRRRSAAPTAADRFLTMFGKPERLLACECERSNETTLSQAFVLVSGEGLNELIAHNGNRLEQLVKSDASDTDLINELYWSALARSPQQQELEASLAMFETSEDRLAALQDIAWALLNAKEFIFRK